MLLMLVMLLRPRMLLQTCWDGFQHLQFQESQGLVYYPLQRLDYRVLDYYWTKKEERQILPQKREILEELR